jgi:hypothetical protein
MSLPEDELVAVPETQVALAWLSSTGQNDRLATSLATMAQRVREIVPECVGLSLGLGV